MWRSARQGRQQQALLLDRQAPARSPAPPRTQAHDVGRLEPLELLGRGAGFATEAAAAACAAAPYVPPELGRHGRRQVGRRRGGDGPEAAPCRRPQEGLQQEPPGAPEAERGGAAEEFARGSTRMSQPFPPILACTPSRHSGESSLSPCTERRGQRQQQLRKERARRRITSLPRTNDPSSSDTSRSTVPSAGGAGRARDLPPAAAAAAGEGRRARMSPGMRVTRWPHGSAAIMLRSLQRGAERVLASRRARDPHTGSPPPALLT